MSSVNSRSFVVGSFEELGLVPALGGIVGSLVGETVGGAVGGTVGIAVGR
jgi:hypothetical protein